MIILKENLPLNNSKKDYSFNKKHMEILKNSSLFNKISLNDLNSLLTCLNPVTKFYNKDSFIIKVGDNISQIGILLEGEGNIIKTDINGNNSILAKLYPSSVFAEAFVCANIKKSPVYVKAIKNSKVLFMDYKNIINICTSACNYHNQLITNLLQIVAEKNIVLNNKIQVVSKKTIKEKVISFLSMEQQNTNKNPFKISFSRQEMADYLSVDRSALSRELSNMKKEGIIDFSKQTFQIL